MTNSERPVRRKVTPFLEGEIEYIGSAMPYRHALPGAYSDNDEDSPYYWWIEYLRRNDQYQECCRNGGKGALAEFFADWGDINTADFDTWFPYEHLFVERAFAHQVETKKGLEEVDLSANMVLVCPTVMDGVPLSSKAIRSLFESFLKTSFATDDRSHWSTARYRIAGNPDPKVLKERLAVYDERKKFPEKSFWRIGADLFREGKISISEHLVEDIENEVSRQAQLEVQIFKMHKRAALHIENSVGREFPSAVLVAAG